ncbi:DUF4012 domain-containing protein [Candidatus Nomurabacteria bacterium]|nr:DUF4012 domain-containing protein [Candidatus Nomurabacteria bacterium]
MPEKKSKKDFREIKRNLVNELDGFLLENDAPKKERNQALAELDLLIKQDLSGAQILLEQYKKNTQNSKEKPRAIVEKTSSDKVQRSANILDLRKISENKKISKKDYRQIFQGLKLPKIKLKKFTSSKKERVSWNLPSLPRINFNFKLAQKLAIFALILAVLLSPFRLLVLLGRIQDDKDSIWQLGKSGILNLQSGVLSASENAYQTAELNFQQALENFSEIQTVLNQYDQWILEAGTKIPLIGKQLNVGTNLLKVADNISQAALVLNQKLQTDESLTSHIAFLEEQIKNTLPYLEDASKSIKKIKIESLPDELALYFANLKDYLPRITNSLSNLEEVLSVLKEVLGESQEKRYLILFQNNNELRATGGFIGSLAVLDIYQGEIKNLEIPRGGTYDLSAGQTSMIKAPQALSLINPYFNIWDANWWPDFPSSAQKISWFYQNFGGSTIDGVIAVNAEVLKALLEVLGPQEMPEYGVVISADNLYSVIQDEVEFNYDKELNQPKAIIADLAPKLLDKLLHSSAEQKQIITTLVEQLANKNIQMYLNNPETQEKIRQFAWSGEVLKSQKDYLQVVNTNIGGGKTDNDIYQSIDHQAEVLDNGEIVNTVRVTRTNKGMENNPLSGIEGGNVSYLRFYVPQGSQFIEAVGFDTLPAGYFHSVDAKVTKDPEIQAEEDAKMIDAASQTEIYESLDKTVFANWVALKPGESQTVAIKYKLPFKLDVSNPLVNNWWTKLLSGDVFLDNYSLLIQAQAGAQNTIFNSSVLLPENLRVVWNQSSVKDKMSVSNKLVTYTNDLLGDQYFGFIVSSK